MSLIEPVLAEAATPDDFARQAAERTTPIGEYLGAKLLGGLEATRPAEAFGLASLPSRYTTDEYGLPPPGPPPADLLTKEQFDASPYKRPNLEYEEGETEARAAARAAVHDRQAYRDSLVARSDAGWLGQTAGFGLGLGAAALDPTNYIPIIGPASKAAMVARFGRIGGALLGHGADAALNTGLFEPLAAATAQAQGRSYGWEEAGSDILTNALGGALLGTAAGEAARALGFGHGLPKTPDVLGKPEAPISENKGLISEVPAARETGTADIPAPIPEAGAGVVPRRPGQPPLRVDDLMRRADAAGLALDQLDRGEPVDVGKLLANDPAVRAEATPASAGAPRVDVESSPADEGGHNKVYTLRDGDGGELAKVKAWSGMGNVSVEWVGTPEATAMHDAAEHAGSPLEGGAYVAAKNRLGPRQMLLLAGEIARDNPEAKWLTGFRVSGAREAGGEIGETAIDLDRFRRRGPMSLEKATPEPPHPSVAEAAARVGKGTPELETFAKDAKLEGYDKPLPGHEPKPEPVPGEPAKPAKPERPPTPAEKAAATAALPPELGEVEAMRREGSLTPADEATLAAGEAEAQKAEGYATAYETLINCVLRNAV